MVSVGLRLIELVQCWSRADLGWVIWRVGGSGLLGALAGYQALCASLEGGHKVGQRWTLLLVEGLSVCKSGRLFVLRRVRSPDQGRNGSGLQS